MLSFNKHNIKDYEFIEKYDREDLTPEQQNIFDSTYQFRKGDMSLELKHFYAIREIAEKYDSGLIFEDDVFFTCDNFMETLKVYMTHLPDNYDMLFIGDGCNLHIEKCKLIPNKYIYEKCLNPTIWGGNGASRCTDSYILSKKCAIKLCDYLDNSNKKINLPIGFWINEAARYYTFNAYWAEPTIATQGTSNGMYKSSLIRY